jgi:hypothetical protein
VLAGETLLRPTRRYTVTYGSGRRVNLDAEGMWPTSTCVEFLVTVTVVGIPRHVVVQRVMLADLAAVERDDGAVAPPVAPVQD